MSLVWLFDRCVDLIEYSIYRAQQLHIHSASVLSVFLLLLLSGNAMSTDDSMRQCQIHLVRSICRWCSPYLFFSHSDYHYFLNKLADEISVRLSRFSVIVSCDSSLLFFSLRLQKEAAKKHDTLNINGFVADDVLGTNKLQPHTNGTSNKMKWPNCHLRLSLSIFQCFVVQMCIFFSLFQSVYLCGVVVFFRCSFSIHFIRVCVDCFVCYNFIKKT